MLGQLGADDGVVSHTGWVVIKFLALRNFPPSDYAECFEHTASLIQRLKVPVEEPRSDILFRVLTESHRWPRKARELVDRSFAIVRNLRTRASRHIDHSHR
jgi:hypothetical protein